MRIYLTFIGTITLGSLTLWQNKRIKEESDSKDKRILFLENEKLRLQYLPSFLFQGFTVNELYAIGKQEDNLESYESYLFTIYDEDSKWLDYELQNIYPLYVLAWVLSEMLATPH